MQFFALRQIKVVFYHGKKYLDKKLRLYQQFSLIKNKHTKMFPQKVLAFLLIQLIVTQSYPQQAFLKNRNHSESFQSQIYDLNLVNESVLNQRQLFQLITSSINEEAKQDLCPYPGFYGDYCVGLQEQQEQFHLHEKTSMKMQQMSQNSETEQAVQSIKNMPSGVGVSFDITTGELKLPAIQLTYQKEPTQEQIWKDPLSDNQFIIADETQVEQIELQPDIKIFQNEQELSNLWIEAAQNGYWLGGQYSHSQDLNQIFEKFFKGDQEMSVSQMTKNVLRMTFKNDNLSLNKYAQRAVNALPQEYSPEVYNDFLESWGTHISVDTYIGGMIEKVNSFKSCVYASPSFNGGLSPQQVEQALNNELNGNPADGYFAARRKIAVDHRFGGNPENESNWENTISQNPALLKINKFVSWDSLVTDAQVKQNLQQAIMSRIESMKERYINNQQSIQEQRRIESNGPKTAYAIQGNGNTNVFAHMMVDINVPIPLFYTISSPFQMNEASLCTPGLPYEISKSRCSSCEFTEFQLFLEVEKDARYERDSLGNFRTILNENYGNWVNKGCSIASVSGFPQFVDLNQIPPNDSRFQVICTDCIPTFYNSPNGNILQCNCPAF
ncbi:MAC/perforin domain protein (macronuclear) [Tetrahymena thermophila SB210]|uniref:MAC/perforin domain protein n=1 Tax=Tetrahymena thermophila (strain SB210) TaxID=312017 RepID=Q23JI8_TETTS|nr:MAC/perforin domain protein [Tetrahymena thermophila SB210]EAR96755.4 MAC/perforin domain protein [Tetrahymena thermophila SB210]|eukprot:XP_001017000.4 MAC/perforin domain protein [Tetrahymena thermophila SB210]